MLTTHDGERLRSRPMAAFVRREEDAVYFLTDAQHHKDEEIHDNPNVGLAFADGQKFVSVTGHATVSRDTGQDQGAVGRRGQGLVGFARRSEHPPAHRDAG